MSKNVDLKNSAARDINGSERCKTLFWVTLAVMVLAAIAIIIFAT